MLKNAAYQPGASQVCGSTASRKKANLGKAAVKAALKGEWERAVEMNQSILDMNPNDCEATNRLAKALMELGDYAEARRILESLQLRVPGNNIARKNLARLDQLQACGGDGRRAAPGDDGLPRMFIADSGKSCITPLRRQGGAHPITSVSSGDAVSLSVHNAGIAVISLDGNFLGTIERRLARRLSRLMSGGNEYAAAVVGSGPDGLSILIRETKQHPALRRVASFPSTQNRPQRNPLASAEPVVMEAHDDYADTAVEDLDHVVTGDPESEDEGAALAIVEEVVVDPDANDDVPTLDVDAESDAWPAITTMAETEQDRE